MFRTFTTAAILALTITAAQAGSASVRYGDLNTANPNDARVLADRIHQAALAACGPERDYERKLLNPAFYQAIEKACVQRASQSALAKIEVVIKRPWLAQQ